MDARCKRIRMYAFTDVNVYVWTGPEEKNMELAKDWLITFGRKCRRSPLSKQNLGYYGGEFTEFTLM